uniref:HhH-GPD domain-containing protein n=1 Tax=Chromera velia CCMP2878 TaxID=1169474 RepID=A0A0G4HDV6_9ALVE|eukprot:Cvel_6486.t1-p1 / transcript=Cvel_6486.t1 / gene=Cvel_6486 / organism=Chromera_velia_CCMP2878 / gene_product=hypothetical protein / transcript_product=hypothetical protein / location=Cvel_scaffold318:34909-36273(-) / protein_length=455 / sequence_SO=supercontig / SO=protein_coding / is_pseudo=false
MKAKMLSETASSKICVRTLRSALKKTNGTGKQKQMPKKEGQAGAVVKKETGRASPPPKAISSSQRRGRAEKAPATSRTTATLTGTPSRPANARAALMAVKIKEEGEGGRPPQPTPSKKRRRQEEETIVKIEASLLKQEEGTFLLPPPPKALKKQETQKSKSRKIKQEEGLSPMQRKMALAAESPSPFPSFHPPLPSQSLSVYEALEALHGPVSFSTDRPVLDSLVRTILSQNTTDRTSARAFEQLKREFPSWRSVLCAPPGAVEESIRVGGLADIKAERVRRILLGLLKKFPLECQHAATMMSSSSKASKGGEMGGGVVPEEILRSLPGEPTLEFLRSWDGSSVREFLTSLDGVGPKTAACVMLFALGLPEFPVDTHVLHIAQKRLKWLPSGANRETAFLHLNCRIPEAIKGPLHVLLVEHGKRCRACSRGSLQKEEIEGTCPLPEANREGRAAE